MTLPNPNFTSGPVLGQDGKFVRMWQDWLALIPRSVNPNPLTKFAGLPTSPVIGQLASVSDGTSNTWGAVQSGGGIHQTLVWYNGSAWTVIGI